MKAINRDTWEDSWELLLNSAHGNQKEWEMAVLLCYSKREVCKFASFPNVGRLMVLNFAINADLEYFRSSAETQLISFSSSSAQSRKLSQIQQKFDRFGTGSKILCWFFLSQLPCLTSNSHNSHVLQANILLKCKFYFCLLLKCDYIILKLPSCILLSLYYSDLSFSLFS